MWCGYRPISREHGDVMPSSCLMKRCYGTHLYTMAPTHNRVSSVVLGGSHSPTGWGRLLLSIAPAFECCILCIAWLGSVGSIDPFCGAPWSCLPHISAAQPPHAIRSVQTQTQLTVMVCSLIPKQFPPPVFDSLLQAIKDRWWEWPGNWAK